MNYQGWFDFFSAVTYAAAGLCTYGAVKRGFAQHQRSSKRWHRVYGVVGQLTVLVVFGVAMWALESYAHWRTPYYVYPQYLGTQTGFRDLIPFANFSWVSHPSSNVCVDHVNCLLNRQNPRIPLTIILFEAVLAYSAMWTSRLMGGKVWARPLLAGLVLVNVDLVLDPVVATVNTCDKSSAVVGVARLGFWQWYAKIPTGPNPFATWFGIPAFNYVAWWAAPVVLVSLVSLFVEGVVPHLERRGGIDATVRPPFKFTWGIVVSVLSIIGAVVAVVYASPNQELCPAAQGMITAGVLLLSAGAFFWGFRKYRTRKYVDQTLTIPLSVALLVPVLPAVIEGEALREPLLMPAIVVSLILGLWIAFLPFRSAIDHFADILRSLDRFVRLHYFGFTVMLVLFGAALADPSVEDACAVHLVGGLVGVAVCFHVFAYVLNDLIDLELDKTVDRRLQDPLASGRMNVETAAGIVATTIPGAVASTLFVTGFSGFQTKTAPYAAFGILFAAFALMTVYNLWGKKIRWPLVTDAIEGLAWGLLVFFGFFAVGAAQGSLTDAWNQNKYALAVLFSCAFLFIFLINGIHGGLRDAKTDGTDRKNTAALTLGATYSDSDGTVRSSPAIQRFAFAVQTLLFAILFAFVLLEPTRWVLPQWAVLVGLGSLLVANSYLLHLVVKTVSPDRNFWISMHLLSLLVPGLVVFWCYEGLATTFKVSVAILFFLPLVLQEEIVEAVISWAYGPRPEPPLCGPTVSPPKPTDLQNGGYVSPLGRVSEPNRREPSDPTNEEVTGVRASESLRAAAGTTPS
jgi:4-hydroxybenzoate polyprenyltransferase